MVVTGLAQNSIEFKLANGAATIIKAVLRGGRGFWMVADTSVNGVRFVAIADRPDWIRWLR